MNTPVTYLPIISDTEGPHGYYPRPQLERDSFLCLNGEWEFSEGGESYNERITVPFCPESAASGIGRRVSDRLFYRRHFSLPDGFVKDRVLLHFGAVDQTCEVYLNGERAGAHEGGYLPFSIDITSLVTEGENELCVMVTDTLDHRYPWGKQKDRRGGMWYTPVSGIWQTVWLESLPVGAVEALTITPTESGAVIRVTGGTGRKRLTLEGGETYEFDTDEITVEPRELVRWTPETPHLYRFTLECGEDRIRSYFASRTVDIREVGGTNRICLNGKPYLFNGLLDQGYWQEGIYTPESVEGYIKDIRLAKSLGFNMLRKHIKIEPMIFYYLCDCMGIAVFQDMVNNGGYSFLRDTALPTVGLQKIPDKRLNRDPETRRIFNESMLDTAALLYNTPSVVYYTVFNEGWGQFESEKLTALLKEIDSTRTYDSVSGWHDQGKGTSELKSYHIYYKKFRMPKNEKRCVVLSEFGGYSLPVDGHMFTPGKLFGYRMYKTEKELQAAVRTLYDTEVLPAVKDGLCATVYTQLSDVEEEINGILTYDRRKNKFAGMDLSIVYGEGDL